MRPRIHGRSEGALELRREGREDRAAWYGLGACVKEKTSESLGRWWEGRGKQGEMQEDVCLESFLLVHTGTAV